MTQPTRNHRRRSSIPHRRLQNLYIGLFLVLGAALCAAEIARQTALREQVGFMRRSFEAAKSGRDAVAVSRNLAGAKMMDAAAPAGAPAMVGFGDREGAAGGGAGGFEPMRTAARRSMRKVADKVFYLARDGCFYDSLFVEDMRDRIEEIKRFSEAYFGLLDRHRDIGRYLADGANLVLCIDDKVYRIVE